MSNITKSLPSIYNLGSSNRSYSTHKSIDFKAVGLLIFIFGCVIALAVGYWDSIINKKPSVCDARRQPNTHIMGVIDATDHLGSRVIDAFRHRLLNHIDTLNPGDRLSIVSITPDSSNEKVIRPYLQICKLKDGHNVDVLTENGAMINKHFQKNYVEVINQSLEGLSQFSHTESADFSPLLRALFEISSLKRFSSKIQNRVLIIASDLIEHSDECSFFKNNCDWGKLSENFYFQGISDQLHNTKIELISVKNQYASQQQKKSFNEFWNHYFQFAGVVENDIKLSTLVVKPRSPDEERKSRQWVVQVAAYQSHIKADSLNQLLAKSGFNSYKQKQDNLYAVFVGPEQCQRAASLTKQLIQRDYQVEGKVISF